MDTYLAATFVEIAMRDKWTDADRHRHAKLAATRRPLWRGPARPRRDRHPVPAGQERQPACPTPAGAR